MPRTDIYQENEDVSVITTAVDERDFLESFTEALRPIMANSMEPHEQRLVISAGFDIIAKLRGYKSSNVQERRVLAAGRWPHPSEVAIASAGQDDPDGFQPDIAEE